MYQSNHRYLNAKYQLKSTNSNEETTVYEKEEKRSWQNSYSSAYSTT